jgi:hypothetical protein
VDFQEKLLSVFGIPPAILLAESTSGRSTLNTNAAALRAESLAKLKQLMMVPIEVMLRVIYGRHVAAKQIMQSKRPPSLEKLSASTKIRVTLPGIPPEEHLHEWYQRGLLKYKALKNYLAAIHLIPIEDFEDEAPSTEMDIQEEGAELQQKTLKMKEKQGTAQLKLKEQQGKQQLQLKKQQQPASAKKKKKAR